MSIAALELVAGIATPLTNLADEEMIVLQENCEAFQVHYPAMAAWIVKLVDAERTRRDEGQVQFPDPPPFWALSGEALAACLRACLVMIQSAATERLRDVADGLLLFVCSFVNRRLIERSIIGNN